MVSPSPTVALFFLFARQFFHKQTFWTKARIATQPSTASSAVNFSNVTRAACHADCCQEIEIWISHIDIVACMCVPEFWFTRRCHLQFVNTHLGRF